MKRGVNFLSLLFTYVYAFTISSPLGVINEGRVCITLRNSLIPPGNGVWNISTDDENNLCIGNTDTTDIFKIDQDGLTIKSSLKLKEKGNNTGTVEIKSSFNTENYTIELPPTAPIAGQVMVSNGSSMIWQNLILEENKRSNEVHIPIMINEIELIDTYTFYFPWFTKSNFFRAVDEKSYLDIDRHMISFCLSSNTIRRVAFFQVRDADAIYDSYDVSSNFLKTSCYQFLLHPPKKDTRLIFEFKNFPSNVKSLRKDIDNLYISGIYLILT